MPIAELPAQLANVATLLGTTVPRATAVYVDDVAVEAKILSGLERSRKKRVVSTVVAGSLLNKVALMPVALAAVAFTPWAILPMLAVGGLNLASEGARNLLGHGHDHGVDNVKLEKDAKKIEKKTIASALKVDLILSAEVTVLALSLIVGAPLLVQLAVLAGTGLAVTGGLYGIVGTIIEAPSIGKWLAARTGKNPAVKMARLLGRGIEKSVPHQMKVISVIGTVALFVIGGELLLHGIPGGEQMVTHALATLSSNALVQGVGALCVQGAVGVAAGFAALPVIKAVSPPLKKMAARLFNRTGRKKEASSKPAAMPAPEEPSSNALQNMPDVKAAMNEAAAPTRLPSPRRKPGSSAAAKPPPV